MNIEIPLISPLSRKYYNYAQEKDKRTYYRAIDIRICLERICDEIVFKLVDENIQKHWGKYKLHNKLKSAEGFIDGNIIKQLISAKVIGNKGAHDGEEGTFDNNDIDKAMVAIREFSIEVFVSYLINNGFDDKQNSWTPTILSTLPPAYRIEILEKLYKHNNSYFVIDKLSKAYLKAGCKEKAVFLLNDCYEKKHLNEYEHEKLINDISLLSPHLHKFPIARDLEMAKNNFNTLLTVIEEEERDLFICLVSIILNGADPNTIY